MRTQASARPLAAQTMRRNDWLRIATGAATLSVIAVVISHLTALAIWPNLAAFEPLNSPPRSALFTAIPAFGAAGIFAWLSRRTAWPTRAFLLVSTVVLLLSIIPDYLLPFAGKTLLASTVTAALHVVAGAVTVAVLLVGYRTAQTSL